MTQAEYDREIGALHRKYERLIDRNPEREAYYEEALSRAVDALDHHFIHGPHTEADD